MEWEEGFIHHHVVKAIVVTINYHINMGITFNLNLIINMSL
jgi:hypothetical protein